MNYLGYGVTANIAASHAAARGSIPRIRTFCYRQVKTQNLVQGCSHFVEESSLKGTLRVETQMTTGKERSISECNSSYRTEFEVLTAILSAHHPTTDRHMPWPTLKSGV